MRRDQLLADLIEGVREFSTFEELLSGPCWSMLGVGRPPVATAELSAGAGLVAGVGLRVPSCGSSGLKIPSLGRRAGVAGADSPAQGPKVRILGPHDQQLGTVRRSVATAGAYPTCRPGSGGCQSHRTPPPVLLA